MCHDKSTALKHYQRIDLQKKCIAAEIAMNTDFLESAPSTSVEEDKVNDKHAATSCRNEDVSTSATDKDNEYTDVSDDELQSQISESPSLKRRLFEAKEGVDDSEEDPDYQATPTNEESSSDSESVTNPVENLLIDRTPAKILKKLFKIHSKGKPSEITFKDTVVLVNLFDKEMRGGKILTINVKKNLQHVPDITSKYSFPKIINKLRYLRGIISQDPSIIP